MSADDETKTTTVFDGKQENYGKYRMKLRGEFCAKGIQSALGPKFKDVLPESEDATSQTVKQKDAVKSNIGGMGVLIKTNKSEEILVLLDSTVSDDWPWGRVNLVIALLDKMFCPKDIMAKAQEKKKLRGRFPHGICSPRCSFFSSSIPSSWASFLCSWDIPSSLQYYVQRGHNPRAHISCRRRKKQSRLTGIQNSCVRAYHT